MIYRENNIFDTYGSKRLNWHELSNVIPSYVPQTDLHVHRCQNLIATVLHTSQHLSKITEPPAKVSKINFTEYIVKNIIFPIYITLFRQILW